MRLIHSFLAALLALAALAGCGTKTPLAMPPPAQPAPKATVTCPQSGTPCTQGAPTVPAVDNTNKAVTEPRQ